MVNTTLLFKNCKISKLSQSQQIFVIYVDFMDFYFAGSSWKITENPTKPFFQKAFSYQFSCKMWENF